MCCRESESRPDEPAKRRKRLIEHIRKRPESCDAAHSISRMRPDELIHLTWDRGRYWKNARLLQCSPQEERETGYQCTFHSLTISPNSCSPSLNFPGGTFSLVLHEALEVRRSREVIFWGYKVGFGHPSPLPIIWIVPPVLRSRPISPPHLYLPWAPRHQTPPQKDLRSHYTLLKPHISTPSKPQAQQAYSQH